MEFIVTECNNERIDSYLSKIEELDLSRSKIQKLIETNNTIKDIIIRKLVELLKIEKAAPVLWHLYKYKNLLIIYLDFSNSKNFSTIIFKILSIKNTIEDKITFFFNISPLLLYH